MDLGVLCADLQAEYDELAGLVEGLSANEWELPTGFFHWTPWDEIAHLLYFDQAALLATSDPESFSRHSRELLSRTVDRGEPISRICRDLYTDFDGQDLTRCWRTTYNQLVPRLAGLDSRARLPWYGPQMSVRSFVTARMMECWAHGQDVWDGVRRRRPIHPRLSHVAHLGASTYAWSFTVRGQQPPGPVPYLELQGPLNEPWSWGEPSLTNAVQGPAQDFCLVVTQRRNVADTDLVSTGAAAQAWMAIAQCFAGGPAIGPRPGERCVAYVDKAGV